MKKIIIKCKIFARNLYWNKFKRKKENAIFIVSDSFESIKLSTYGDIPRILFRLSFLRTAKESFEYKTIQLIEKISINSNVIIDIGANIGLISIIASKSNPSAKIYSIEPSKNTFNALVYNIKINKLNNIKAYQIALSENEGTLTLYTPELKYKEYSDSFKCLDISNTNNVYNSDSAESVEVLTLSNFINKNIDENIDLIKIDIEGAELLCFKGAADYFLSHKNNLPIIVFENSEHNNNKYNYSIADTLVFLSSFGYFIYNYDAEQWIAYPSYKKDYVFSVIKSI